MNVLETKKLLEKLPFERQLLFAVLSSERAFREVNKFFPNFLKNKTKFSEILDELWKYLANKSNLTKEDWRKYGLEIEEFFKNNSNYGNQTSLLETSNALKLTMGMIIWGNDSYKDAAGCSLKSGKFISEFYDDRKANGLDGIKWYLKEIEIITKALYLIAESEEIPTSYQWFLERIPDYERGTIYKKFKDIE